MAKFKNIVSKRLNKPPKMKLIVVGDRSHGQKDQVLTMRLPSCTQSAVVNCEPVDMSNTAIPYPSSSQMEMDAIPDNDSRTKHHVQNQNRNEAWQSIRGPALKAYIESISPKEQRCSLCGVSLKRVIRCTDCGPITYYCDVCCQKVHQFVKYHIPTIWQNEMYMPYISRSAPLYRTDHLCATKYPKNITVIDGRGMDHEEVIECCECEDPAITFVRFKLWPASPSKPQMAFHFSLMEQQRLLQMEAHVPLYSFCRAMKQLTSHHLRLKMPINLYRFLVGEPSTEYSFHKFSCENLTSLVPALSTGILGMDCPACPKLIDDTDPVIVAVDANFGLVRKKSSSLCMDPAKRNTFFMDQDVVDERVTRVADLSSKELDCSEFQAGNSLRTKVKTSKLDETAVFGSMCRHEFPLLFCNIRSSGERLGYSIYMLEELKDLFGSRRIVFMYDIACMLHKHLKTHNKGELLENVSLAVPIFHNYGHKMSCQIQYSPRRIPGLGLSDGEALERLWSYLRKFAGMTKQMTAGHRTDVLEAALEHYGKEIRGKIACTLRRKLVIAVDVQREQSTRLDQIQEEHQVSLSDIQKWEADERGSNATRKLASVQSEASWQELYAWMLYQHLKPTDLSTTAQTRNTCSCNEQKLLSIEKKRKILRWDVTSSEYLESLSKYVARQQKFLLETLKSEAAERRFSAELIAKYADGQGIGQRLRKQMAQASSNIKKHIAEYNDLQQCHKLGEPLIFQAVIAEDWNNDAALLPLPNAGLPSKCVRKAIDALCKKTRADEEIAMSKRDMARVVTFFKSEHSKIARELEICRKTDDTSSHGVVTLLINNLMKTELELRKCEEEFSSYIDIEPFDYAYVNQFVEYHHRAVEMETEKFSNDDDCQDEMEENDDDDDDDDDDDEVDIVEYLDDDY